MQVSFLWPHVLVQSMQASPNPYWISRTPTVLRHSEPEITGEKASSFGLLYFRNRDRGIEHRDGPKKEKVVTEKEHWGWQSIHLRLFELDCNRWFPPSHFQGPLFVRVSLNPTSVHIFLMFLLKKSNRHIKWKHFTILCRPNNQAFPFLGCLEY